MRTYPCNEVSILAATLLWLRSDLRLADNPALDAAVRRGAPVIPVFVWSPEEEAPWQPGGASRVWLHHSLAALDHALRSVGSRLVVRSSPRAGDALRALIADTGSDAVFWNRRYEPAVAARDALVAAELKRNGIAVDTFNGALLVEPWEIATGQGTPFQVFTPFYKRFMQIVKDPLPKDSPRRIPGPRTWPESTDVSSLELLPTIDWAAGIREVWRPGERSAHETLDEFLTRVDSYADTRDLPGVAGTSRLSPHLHFGEIGPRQIWYRLSHTTAGPAAEKFRSEIAWREFAHHVLHHFPHTPEEPLRASFRRFPWQHDADAIRAWRRGQTGFPIVDAGMRELWTTGWMHNRVRMIVASFLVKDLLVSWREGAQWFWDTLVDADLANNTMGWQWSAGCGADAAPYFRVFNPVSQGKKFDAGGDYVRRWVPELARLDSKWIHCPHEAPAEVLRAAGVTLDRDYPRPIVDHAEARARALNALRICSAHGAAPFG